MTKFYRAALAASALTCAGVAVPAQAGTTIQLNGLDAITNTGARQGYRVAAAYWESVLTNNATVVFDIGFSALDPGVLAQAGSQRLDVSTNLIYNRMVATGNSSLDAIALASLGSEIAAAGGVGVNMRLSRIADPTQTFFDTTHTGANSNNNVTYANTSVLKALGLLDDLETDASITFSSEIQFDFDPSDGITAGFSDFVGVAIHEMGHGLGFVSDVDFYDFYASPNGPGYNPAFSDATFQNIGGLNSTLDLFRYNSNGELDWSVGSDTFFSIDGGLTQYNGNSYFSSGQFNGDGWQASHWRAPRNAAGQFTCNKANRIGIMNPYLCGGQGGDVTNEDIAAFDAMGWNTSVDALGNPNYVRSSGEIFSQFAAAVPEPSTWAMLILGFGVAGAAMRRKNKAQARYAF